MVLSPQTYGGDLPAVMSVIFTATDPCYVTDLRFYSRVLAAQTVQVNFTPIATGVSTEWGPVWPLAQGECAIHVADGERRLMATGDTISAATTSPAAVGWSMSLAADV